MTTSKAATSRAPSARSASVARMIAKKRDKPYKTEHSRVIAKKRKLNLHTTYTKAPPGFQFLPVGTPDLAERCKELSRQRGLPVNVVNAKPVSKTAEDPGKISHHIHRIGYHFHLDVLEDACQELGYTYNHGAFVKERELVEQAEHSAMARAMARHGLQLDQPSQRESDEQVRAAIKELFPRIPEDDLKAILKHAWEEGSKRVGLNATLDLPRRVQLATIARIRHMYTDYDRLLKAFEWKHARAEVEPTCLAKLIEWRGEHEAEDDNELEEVVRETIVIDDDEDDDSDSVVDIDPEYNSDTSVEISHRLAGEGDLGAESQDERSRHFLSRYQPPPARNARQRHIDVGHQIGNIRQQFRNGVNPLMASQPEVIRVHVPDSASDTVEVGGQLFRRVCSELPVSAADSLTRSMQKAQVPAPPTMPSTPLRNYRPSPQDQTIQPYSRHTNSALQDQPIASIEQHGDLPRQVAISAPTQQHGLEPTVSRASLAKPDVETSRQGRHGGTPNYPILIDSDDSQLRHWSLLNAGDRMPNENPQRSGEVVDLTVDTSPRGPPESHRREPDGHLHHFRQSNHRPAPEHPAVWDPYRQTQGRAPVDATAYDPQRPFMALNHRPVQHRDSFERRADPRAGFGDAQGAPAPIQYVPHPQQSTGTASILPSRYETQYRSSGSGALQQPQVVYLQPPRQGYTPQPVHGAPAAVQTISRDAGRAGQQPGSRGSIPASAVNVQQVFAYDHMPQQKQPQYYYPR